MPPENTTLFFPALKWSRRDAEEEHSISRVTPTVTDPNIRHGDNVKENELAVVEYEHLAKVNVTTAIPDGKLYLFQEGSEDRSQPVDSPSLPHSSTEVATRGSNVYWGSEDGVVHIRRWPRHTPKKHTVVTNDAASSTHKEMISIQETEELLSHNHEKRTTQSAAYTQEMEESSTHHIEEMVRNTEEIEEIPSIAPEVRVTERPEAEDWFTDIPEGVTDAPGERLVDNGDRWETDRTQTWPTITYEESSTKTLGDGAIDIYQNGEWSTFAPEEQSATLPEEWLSTTPSPEDDWLTIIPQDEEQLTDIQSAPSLPPTPPSLSPTPASVFPSLRTPTVPPSLPPTPSPQDAVEDSLRITTRGLDFLLEASPTGQSSPDTTEFPKDDLFTLDLTITTTRKGLNADVRDVIFDPSQIAKATSYEGSSYPTATRSATVTTTWVEDDRLSSPDHQNLTMNDELLNPRVVGDLSKLSTELQHQHSGSEDGDTSTLPANDELSVLQLDGSLDETYKGSDTQSRSGSPTQTQSSMAEENNGDSTTATFPDSTESQEKDEDSTEHPRITFLYDVHHHKANTSGRSLELPVVTLSMSNGRNDNSTVRGSSNKTEEAVMYEIPLVTRNPGQALNPSVVVALSVCCAVVMVLAALSVALWVCRRHRNRSKVYLSREAAKPRAFFTRPMNPAVLPDESDHEDAVYMLEFQRPRPPIMLDDDQKGIYFIKQEEGEGSEGCRASLGIENGAFTDVPLGKVGDQGRARLDPPKYDLKRKQDSDADSGIRVWSSTGSLHAASSPLPTHCRVPPPPYSPSISKESVCLSVHSLPSLPRNSQLFDV